MSYVKQSWHRLSRDYRSKRRNYYSLTKALINGKCCFNLFQRYRIVYCRIISKNAIMDDSKTKKFLTLLHTQESENNCIVNIVLEFFILQFACTIFINNVHEYTLTNKQRWQVMICSFEVYSFRVIHNFSM